MWVFELTSNLGRPHRIDSNTRIRFEVKAVRGSVSCTAAQRHQASLTS
jgi:hypothetical protein